MRYYTQATLEMATMRSYTQATLEMNSNDKNKIEETTQNSEKDLEALTSEIEEGWKHVEKKKGKRKNNEKETNQDLDIENNDVKENKDHEQ
ncbi:hypothetical protein H5410_046502 [Solanum commersonii]|uniref:Uncharacterized protein n=1 Tax=Solanum commersonii TaxID=4109 RepID=A0A9J5XFP7_SOLCO|nr:hypothetical protein H5410_046502 [Solanum commersonii]